MNSTPRKPAPKRNWLRSVKSRRALRIGSVPSNRVPPTPPKIGFVPKFQNPSRSASPPSHSPTPGLTVSFNTSSWHFSTGPRWKSQHHPLRPGISSSHLHEITTDKEVKITAVWRLPCPYSRRRKEYRL